LLEFIDAENLPDFLGGKSKVPIHANVGPWNDYEMVAPKGIKKKGAAEEEKKEEAKVEETEEEVKAATEAITAGVEKVAIE